jgi:hypothetical protein
MCFIRIDNKRFHLSMKRGIKMLEYIERESSLETAKELSKGSFSTPLIIAAIENAPKADVVEVVRCKECSFFKRDTDYCKKRNKGYCFWDNTIKTKTHYCSYGERKEGAEE